MLEIRRIIQQRNLKKLCLSCGKVFNYKETSETDCVGTLWKHRFGLIVNKNYIDYGNNGEICW